MATLSLNKAEKVAGKTKKTIRKDLDDGSLSGTKNSRGHWEIEESELARFYDLNTDDLVSTPTPTPLDTTPDDVENRIKIAELQATLEAERKLTESLSEQIEQLREDAKEQRADFRQTLAVLEDQRAKPWVDTRGWWDRLRNKQPA